MTNEGKPVALSDDDLDLVVGGTGPVSSSTSVNMSNIQGMDIETALMMVQSQRASVLEGQLKSQMEGVQARNENIIKLNSALGEVNELLKGFGKDAKPGDTVKTTHADGKSYLESMLTELGQPGADKYKTAITKDDADKLVGQLKSMVDSQSNSQQMDMLRLQSMSNKRNEAFDIMTNFVKKMQESRSSIIGNMR